MSLGHSNETHCLSSPAHMPLKAPLGKLLSVLVQLFVALGRESSFFKDIHRELSSHY